MYRVPFHTHGESVIPTRILHSPIHIPSANRDLARRIEDSYHAGLPATAMAMPTLSSRIDNMIHDS